MIKKTSVVPVDVHPKTPDYRNWVSKKLIYIPGLLSVLSVGLALIFPPAFAFVILFLFTGAYFVWAWYQFSPGGGNIQVKVLNMIVDHLDWNGEGQALDIGCGNAPLTIMLAQQFPQSRVTGIDYWGKNWDYSQGICQQNATQEGVGERTQFQKASASALPFEDDQFDLVVSNLVFHEVAEVKDKRELLREALRVVKKGGKFVFQDLFVEKMLYGEVDDLLKLLQSWGIEKVAFVKTCDASFIPAGLKLPFMIGKIGIIYGEK